VSGAESPIPRRPVPPWPVPRPAELPAVSAEYLASAARAMRTVFEAVEDDRADDAAAMVNQLLGDTGARPQLDRVPGEAWQVHFHGASDTYGVGWAAGCATALALAIGSELAGRLGVCVAPRCDRVYVDASRNAVRRFCSAQCQSRVKAAAFRARQESDDAGQAGSGLPGSFLPPRPLALS